MLVLVLVLGFLATTGVETLSPPTFPVLKLVGPGGPAVPDSKGEIKRNFFPIQYLSVSGLGGL